VPYLEAAHPAMLILSFPPSKEWQLLFESEGLQFMVMPLTRDR
jgi:hypothetical protein